MLRSSTVRRAGFCSGVGGGPGAAAAKLPAAEAEGAGPSEAAAAPAVRGCVDTTRLAEPMAAMRGDISKAAALPVAAGASTFKRGTEAPDPRRGVTARLAPGAAVLLGAAPRSGVTGRCPAGCWLAAVVATRSGVTARWPDGAAVLAVVAPRRGVFERLAPGAAVLADAPRSGVTARFPAGCCRLAAAAAPSPALYAPIFCLGGVTAPGRLAVGMLLLLLLPGWAARLPVFACPAAVAAAAAA